MTTPTINAIAVAAHHQVRPLPVALPDVDPVLRGHLPLTGDRWHALEAVLVAVAGAEPPLTAPGGRLAKVEPSHLCDPWHRHLWLAYARLRAEGALVAPLGLDVLGGALSAVGCDDPAAVVAYVSALWAAGWRDTVGLNLSAAVERLRERDTYVRNVEALAAQGAALGLATVPVERVSVLAVKRTEAVNTDTHPRPPAVTPRGEAGESPARGSGECPQPQYRTRWNADGGRLESVPVPCERRACAYCGPRWQAAHLEPVVDALGDADAWAVVVSATEWPTVLRRLNRASADYKRVPVPNTDTVLVLSTVELRGADRVSAADVPTVLGDALEAVRTVPRVKVTASTAWSLATAERAQAVDTDTTGGWEYVGNARSIDLLERTLVWWRAAVERKRDAHGRERLTAIGVTRAAVDALWSNRVVIHPDTLAAEAAERSRKRERERAERETWERNRAAA